MRLAEAAERTKEIEGMLDVCNGIAVTLSEVKRKHYFLNVMIVT